MQSKNKKFLFLVLGITAVICLALFIGFFFKRPAQDKVLRGVAWFRFNQKNSLKGWEEKIFKGRVIYSVKTDGGGYLNAYSKNSASGIMYWLKFNPRTNPMVSWKWKVVKFPDRKKGTNQDSNWLEKDDYAARFYIIFPRFPFFRLQCLEYVWDRDLPAGTVLTNPNFKNLKIVVAESGDKNLGNWVTVERNIYEDFKQYFGTSPGTAGAIAIMTNSDNSESTAEAQYNDIEVGYEK